LDLPQIIQDWGCLALLVGAFLEGETVILIGGFFASRGYLSLPLVMLCAFAGSLAGDQFAFFIGRKLGRGVIRRRARLRLRAAKILRWIQRYDIAVLLGFRFVYGFRNLTPFTLGATGFRPWRFAFYNVIGAALWAVIMPSLGYVFGTAIEALLADVQKGELWIIAAVIIAASVYGAVWHVRKRHEERATTNAADDGSEPRQAR
jgi:membrane protein DedA with SNARE-associated domain